MCLSVKTIFEIFLRQKDYFQSSIAAAILCFKADQNYLEIMSVFE